MSFSDAPAMSSSDAPAIYATVLRGRPLCFDADRLLTGACPAARPGLAFPSFCRVAADGAQRWFVGIPVIIRFSPDRAWQFDTMERVFGATDIPGVFLDGPLTSTMTSRSRIEDDKVKERVAAAFEASDTEALRIVMRDVEVLAKTFRLPRRHYWPVSDSAHKFCLAVDHVANRILRADPDDSILAVLRDARRRWSRAKVKTNSREALRLRIIIAAGRYGYGRDWLRAIRFESKANNRSLPVEGALGYTADADEEDAISSRLTFLADIGPDKDDPDFSEPEEGDEKGPSNVSEKDEESEEDEDTLTDPADAASP